MANSLVLEGGRCLDGVEMVPDWRQGIPPEVEPLPGWTEGAWLKNRSGRLAAHRIEHSPLSPLVQSFVNARTDVALVDFFAGVGLPSPWAASGGFKDVSRVAVIRQQQEWLATAIGYIRDGQPQEAADHITLSFEQNPDLGVVPYLANKPAGPVLELQAKELYSFMLMEVMMLAAGGARLTNCRHCGDFFVTGSGTGRTERAEYCSARCRVAASRARKAGMACEAV